MKLSTDAEMIIVVIMVVHIAILGYGVGLLIVKETVFGEVASLSGSAFIIFDLVLLVKVHNAVSRVQLGGLKK